MRELKRRITLAQGAHSRNSYRRSPSRLLSVILFSSVLSAISVTNAQAALPTITSMTYTADAVAGGTVDTITGTNLLGAISVTVGGVSATLGNNTNTSLEFTIPAGNVGSQSVVVTTAGGASVSAFTITYYSSLTPACGTSGFFTIDRNNTVISNSSCKGAAVVPNGVKTIGANAFVSNSNMFTIDLPATVTTFGANNNYGPFRNSYLTAVTFQPNSQLTAIQSGAFRSTPYLQYISLPTSVTTLHQLAFSDYLSTNGLRWIEIPATVTYIDTSTPYGAIHNYVPLTCIITPVGSVARTLAGRFTTGSSNSTAGAANPSFVTTIADCPAPTVSSISATQGSANGGTTVTLTGTNLWNVNEVTIGGVAATITSLPSSTSIVIKTPAGSTGIQNIVVGTPGPDLNATQTFTYLNPPAISSISASSGSASGGETLTVTGTNLTGVTSVKIGGVSATSIRSNTSTSVTVTTPAGSAGVQDVLVTTSVDSATLAASFTYYLLTSSFSEFSIAGSITSTNFRSTVTITATVAYASKVTFKYRNVRIPGCISLKTPLTGPFTVTCSWRPAHIGAGQLTATSVPNSGGITTGVATPINVSVTTRAGSR